MSDLFVFLIKSFLWHSRIHLIQDLCQSHVLYPPPHVCFELFTSLQEKVAILSRSQERRRLLSLTALSAVTLPLADKRVSELLKRLPDAFNIWTSSSSQAPPFCACHVYSVGVGIMTNFTSLVVKSWMRKNEIECCKWKNVPEYVARSVFQRHLSTGSNQQFVEVVGLIPESFAVTAWINWMKLP